MNKEKQEWLDYYNERYKIISLLDKQEKIINAMAEDIYGSDTIFYFKNVNSVEELKQYYEKKVSEINEVYC